MLSLQATLIILILDICASQLLGNYWRPHYCLESTAGIEEACVVVAALLYGRHLVWGLPSAMGVTQCNNKKLYKVFTQPSARQLAFMPCIVVPGHKAW